MASQKWRASSSPTGYAASAKCQKCLETGHWTFDCTKERVYKARPTRTAILKNPKLEQKIDVSNPEDDKKKVVDDILKKPQDTDSDESESESEEE